jgi:hypothetical protein
MLDHYGSMRRHLYFAQERNVSWLFGCQVNITDLWVVVKLRTVKSLSRCMWSSVREYRRASDGLSTSKPTVKGGMGTETLLHHHEVYVINRAALS